MIGRTSRSFPHSKPDVRLSPHPAFQVTTTLLRGSRPDILVSQGRTRGPHDMAPDKSAFPVRSVGPCLEATAGIPFTIRSVTSWLLPWRTFALYIPLQDIIWLLRRLRLPQRPLAFSRLRAWLVSRCRDDLVDFPSSEARDDRTFSCLLHAGWSWGQRGLGGGPLTPATLPFGPGVKATSTCRFSRRSRRFLSSAWVQDWSVDHFVASSAELLSAGSTPRCLPSIDACCVALMPLSWHISFQSNLLPR